MQHLMVGDKSLLVGDAFADLLLRYGALVGRTGKAETVSFNAWDSEGNETRAGLLLNAGTVLVTESSHSSLRAPDNSDAEALLAKHLAAYDLDGTAMFGSDAEETGPNRG